MLNIRLRLASMPKEELFGIVVLELISISFGSIHHIPYVNLMMISSPHDVWWVFGLLDLLVGIDFNMIMTWPSVGTSVGMEGWVEMDLVHVEFFVTTYVATCVGDSSTRVGHSWITWFYFYRCWRCYCRCWRCYYRWRRYLEKLLLLFEEMEVLVMMRILEE